MRQRKLRNLDLKYEAYEDLIVYEPAEMRGRWSERSGGAPLFIEIGCGKGKFISELASREPGNYFVAVEGNKSVMLRAMEKIRKLGLTNVAFVPELAGDLSEWFCAGEADGIYLNFSDPLPKNYWYKRRLTYRDRLKSYFRVLKPEGTVTFKTDNTDLFEWSETEYEAKYSGFGEKIKRVVIGQRRVADACAGTEAEKTEDMIKSIAAFNGRDIPKEDRVFASVARAKAAVQQKGPDAVYNATAGALMDDDGKLVVLGPVAETIRSLSDNDFAEYAPIAGTPEFRKAVLKAAFGDYVPKSHVRVVASPGGTGSVRTAVDNYSCPGDRILTHSWHWAPYKTIAAELGRGLECFEMFDEEGRFNLADFDYKWYGVKKTLDEVPLEKKVALVADVAYIDYAGEPEDVRSFLSVIDNLRANILPVIAYSASKTFTMYGFRCAAMICLAHSPEIADEFESICSFSARNTWSNSPRPAMTTVSRIMNDPELLARTEAERAEWRSMLLARGRAFEEAAKEAGLEIVPFTAGFFVTVPYEDSGKLCSALEEKDVFVIAISGGIRAAVASLSEDKCRRLPAIIKAVMDELA